MNTNNEHRPTMSDAALAMAITHTRRLGLDAQADGRMHAADKLFDRLDRLEAEYERRNLKVQR